MKIEWNLILNDGVTLSLEELPAYLGKYLRGSGELTAVVRFGGPYIEDGIRRRGLAVKILNRDDQGRENVLQGPIFVKDSSLLQKHNDELSSVEGLVVKF